jgi:hypothetical protein
MIRRTVSPFWVPVNKLLVSKPALLSVCLLQNGFNRSLPHALIATMGDFMVAMVKPLMTLAFYL